MFSIEDLLNGGHLPFGESEGALERTAVRCVTCGKLVTRPGQFFTVLDESEVLASPTALNYCSACFKPPTSPRSNDRFWLCKICGRYTDFPVRGICRYRNPWNWEWERFHCHTFDACCLFQPDAEPYPPVEPYAGHDDPRWECFVYTYSGSALCSCGERFTTPQGGPGVIMGEWTKWWAIHRDHSAPLTKGSTAATE
jgi:ribosomal protein S27E